MSKSILETHFAICEFGLDVKELSQKAFSSLEGEKFDVDNPPMPNEEYKKQMEAIRKRFLEIVPIVFANTDYVLHRCNARAIEKLEINVHY